MIFHWPYSKVMWWFRITFRFFERLSLQPLIQELLTSHSKNQDCRALDNLTFLKWTALSGFHTKNLYKFMKHNNFISNHIICVEGISYDTWEAESPSKVMITAWSFSSLDGFRGVGAGGGGGGFSFLSRPFRKKKTTKVCKLFQIIIVLPRSRIKKRR